MPRAARRPRPRSARRRRLGVLPAVLLGVALAALAGGLLGAFALRDGGGSKTSGSAGSGAIRLSGLTAYDPEGSPPGEEHNSEAKNAADGNQTTYWQTEHYNGAQLNKSGVGVSLYPDHARDPATLLESADEAMYRVKNSG